MVASKQSLPSDARDDFFQPDWNPKFGNGVEVPEDRDTTESLEVIYGRQKTGEAARIGDNPDPDPDPDPEPAELIFTSITPDNPTAYVETEFTIIGTGFTGIGSVRLGNDDGGKNLDVVPISDTEIRVTFALSAGTYYVLFRATSDDDALLIEPDAVVATGVPGPEPTVSDIDPASGPVEGGTELVLTGLGFDQVATVVFGQNMISTDNFERVSNTEIHVTTPPQPTENPELVSLQPLWPWSWNPISISGFSYTEPSGLTFSSITPNSGTTAGGTPVVVTGTGFLGIVQNLEFYQNTLDGYGQATDLVIISDTELHATTPAMGQPVGLVKVRLSTAPGQGVEALNAFTFTTP